MVAVEVDPTLAAALPDTVAAARTGARRPARRSCSADALQVRDAARPAADRAGGQPAVQRRRCRWCCTFLERFPTLRAGAGDGAARGGRAAGRRARARKTYGVPSVKAAWYADVRLAGTVRPQRVLAGAQRRLRPGRAGRGASRRRPTASRAEVFAVHRRGVRPAAQDPAGGARRLGRRRPTPPRRRCAPPASTRGRRGRAARRRGVRRDRRARRGATGVSLRRVAT